MSNETSASAFLLLEFSEARELQILHFFVLLALYLTTVTGNLLIILAVTFDNLLDTPMYFFLTNLAVMDLGTVSTIVPKSMANSIMNSRSIPYFGCVAQVFFFFLFAGSDFYILTVMAYDRYVAICNPLQYETIMNKGACIQMAVIVWFCGGFYATLHTGGTFANTFCSNIIHQFFCEVPSLLKLSCSDIYLVEVGLLVLNCSLALGCFVYIIITYVQIFSTVFKIPSVNAQRKALATCLPHLTVVSLLVFTGVFANAKPPTDIPSDLDVAFGALYTIIPSMLNPFIYSMRNREIKAALSNLLNFGHFSKYFLHLHR